MRLAPALLLALALLAPSGPLRAQDARLQRLDPGTAAAVAALADSARASGLPSEPIVLRALEGSAKGASGERIIAAVRALARDLGAARRVLGPAAPAADLVSAAAALAAGVPAGAVAELRDAGRGGVAAPCIALVALMRQGVAPADAQRVIGSAWRAGVPDAQLLLLQRQVEADVRAGAAPAQAVAARAAALLGAPRDRPEERR